MMSSVRDRIEAFGYRRLAMTIVALVPLLLYFGVFGFWRIQLAVVTVWFGGLGIVPEEFTLLPHRLHDIGFLVMFWPFTVGLLVQLRKPMMKIAAQLMALATFVGILIAIGVTGHTRPIMIVVMLGVPTLIATLLHPAGRELVTSINTSRINRMALALVVVAAVPLLAYAATQTGLQTGAIEPAHDHTHGVAGYTAEEIHEQHVEFGHYMSMVAFSLIVLFVGLISSLRQPGWRIAAWLTGIMTVVFGLTALAAPSAASTPDMLWAAATVVWGGAFIGATEYTRESDAPSPYGERGSTASD